MASTEGPTTKAVWFRKSITLTLLSTPFNRKLFWPFERTPLAEKPPPTESRAPVSAGTTPGERRGREGENRRPPRRRPPQTPPAQIGPTRRLFRFRNGGWA